MVSFGTVLRNSHSCPTAAYCGTFFTSFVVVLMCGSIVAYTCYGITVLCHTILLRTYVTILVSLFVNLTSMAHILVGSQQVVSYLPLLCRFSVWVHVRTLSFK